MAVRRLVGRTIAVLVVLAVCLAAATTALWPVYVTPKIDALRPADAIFVLGGDGYKRYALGFELGKQHYASTVIWSVEKGGPSAPWMKTACDSDVGFTLMCISADEGTTKGEGQMLHRLATEHGWRTVIVVTYRPHISRARYILEKCYSGNLVMIDSPADITPLDWTYQFFYQSAGYVRAFLSDSGC